MLCSQSTKLVSQRLLLKISRKWNNLLLSHLRQSSTKRAHNDISISYWNHLSSQFIQLSYTSNTKPLPKVKGKDTLWNVEDKIRLFHISLCLAPPSLKTAPKWQCYCFQLLFNNDFALLVSRRKKKYVHICYHRYAPSFRSRTSKGKPQLTSSSKTAYLRGRQTHKNLAQLVRIFTSE